MKLFIFLSLFSLSASAFDVVDQKIRDIEIKRRASCQERSVDRSIGCRSAEFSFVELFKGFLGKSQGGPALGSCIETHRYRCSNGMSSFNVVLDVRVDMGIDARTIRSTRID